MITPDSQNVYFSIIIPVFNKEKYINRAISSIINQIFQDFEIIIVNDASIDNTMNIINEFSKQNSKITVLNHQKNESQHVARLNGVTVASGKYILFLDGDDYFIEKALSILFETIQKNPGYDFYEFGYIRKPSGETIYPSLSRDDRFLTFFNKENVPAHTMWNKVYDAKLIKKAFIDIEKAYINYAEDIYESIIIAFYTEKFLNLEKVIINYQVGSGTSTTYKNYDQTIESLQSIQKVIRLVENFIQKKKKNVNTYNLNYRLLTLVINTYFNIQKNKEDKRKLFHVLPTFFNITLIMDFMFELEESKRNILNSKYFRLVIFLLKPLRKIKRILSRNNIRSNINNLHLL